MKQIEYFYSTHSAFAYIGSAKLLDIAAAAGREVVHRPVNLGPVMQAAGGKPSRERTDAHRQYFFGREIERWAEHRQVPIIDYRPTHHDNSLALSSGMVIAAMEQGLNVDKLVHAIMVSHWRDDSDLADAPTLAAVARTVDVDPEPLLEKAMASDIQAKFEANTKEAIERSVFGSPTYFVDGDMFYGQDHLELVDMAFSKPFGGQWPR
ncbi:MAG: 2-hydroxychromene-2-carboxylate isomerase [Pseudomonadota bacterium]